MDTTAADIFTYCCSGVSSSCSGTEGVGPFVIATRFAGADPRFAARDDADDDDEDAHILPTMLEYPGKAGTAVDPNPPIESEDPFTVSGELPLPFESGNISELIESDIAARAMGWARVIPVQSQLRLITYRQATKMV